MSYPVAARPSPDQRARRIARDIAFTGGNYTVAANHDWGTLNGIAAIRQAVLNRLITSPGEFAFRPDYGVGVLEYLKEELTEARIAELATRIRSQLVRDRRISRVDVLIEEFAAPGTGLRISITVVVAGQPLTLAPFAFSSDGVHS